MLVEILPSDYDSPPYDACGNATYATLKINGVIISLCDDCIKELTEKLDKFNSTVFCHLCKHFMQNKYGITYSGSCRKKANGKDIAEAEVGYAFCTDWMGTCEYAERR